ncbi:MAG TPA: hypothetical protein VK862_15110 [Afifellaceae bacterium]|nr:hypothetical protein [Afifellaceae bacterium]
MPEIEQEIDIPADQIVHWLRAVLKSAKPRVRCTATREYVADADPDLVPEFESAGLGPEDDASSLITVGVLVITPADSLDGWHLTVAVEDVVGPHVPEDESAPDEPEEIDLDGYWDQFVKPGRGTETVTLTAESDEAMRHFETVFADLVRDRHEG